MTYPSEHGVGSDGLWIARQVCDAVEIRSTDSGSQARLRMPGSRSVEPLPTHLPWTA